MNAHTADTLAMVISLVSLGISLQTVVCLVCGLTNPVGCALLAVWHGARRVTRYVR